MGGRLWLFVGVIKECGHWVWSLGVVTGCGQWVVMDILLTSDEVSVLLFCCLVLFFVQFL